MNSRRAPWWRRRRLIAAVVCVDLLAAGVLVYALTRPSGHSKTTGTAVAGAVVHRHQAVSDHVAASSTSSTTTAATAHIVHQHHRPKLAAATVMTNPNQSRAPKVSQKAKARAGGSSLDTGGPSANRPLDANARASFTRLASRLPGDGRIAVAAQPLGGGPMEEFGGSPAMPAMSTSKIFILTSLLLDKGGVQNFTSEQKSLAQTAITESDNDSILALFSDLEADQGGLDGASAYATDLLHKAGDVTTTVSTGPIPAGYATTFGQTPWTPAQEVTFFRSLANGCLIPTADTDYELGLMGQIIPSESWGLGSAGFRDVAFKGGWGPLPGGYGVRQTGIIGTGDKAVVVSIAADPASSFETGQSVLDQIATWLHKEIRPVAHPAASCSK